MARFLVVSDSHGDIDIMQGVVNRHRGDCTHFYHLGDSEISPFVIDSMFLGVRGNCDMWAGLPLTRDIPFSFGTVHLEHGNRTGGITPEYAASLGCRILIYGHTHRKRIERLESGIGIVNPGSLTRPRDGDYGSYLVLDVDDNTGEITRYAFHMIDVWTGKQVKVIYKL